MPIPRPAFTMGIEEEYLLVDRQTRGLVADPPGTILEACQAALGERVAPEFMRSQIEIGTAVTGSIEEARRELRHARSVVAECAEREGLAFIAASTHPFGHWREQLPTAKERYQALAADMGAVLAHLLIGGMHVHVGIEDPDLRIDLMNQASYFLPHLLALSTSSPFWRGHDTGLKSYRMSVFYSMPRTGLPEQFSSWGEYQRHVEVMVRAGLIEDASKLWWDLRPSARFPTVELRIPDICTRARDGIAVAALYQSILGMLFHRRLDNQKWRAYADMLVSENVWRAQRYGISERLVDFGIGELVPYGELLEELVELVTPAATELGCLAEVEHARTIVREGTSADRQLAAYREATAAGAGPEEALRAVVDRIAADTREGL